MSSPTRTPGPVKDAAVPINSAATEEQENTAGKNDKNRSPGKVEEPSEPIIEPERQEPKPQSIVSLEMIESSPWKIVFWLLVATFFFWLLVELVLTVGEAFNYSSLMGGALAAITVVMLIAFGWAVKREISAFRSTDQLVDRDEQIGMAVAESDLYRLRDVMEPTLQNLRKSKPGLIKEFEDAASQRESTSDYLKQFENIVLTELDTEANEVIKRSVLIGSASVAVLPHPAFDAIAVLWRAKALTQKLGEIYGLAPTGLSSVRLIKHAITSAMIAGSVEMAGELLVARMSQDALDITFTNIFKSLGEGAAIAVRLHRLGKITQGFCRPTLP